MKRQPAQKKRRQITLDKDIDKKLEQENASGLINRLLKKYFKRVRR